MSLNILIFPGGTEIGLEIYKSLHCCKDIRVFSAGSPVSTHAPYLFKNHFTISTIHDPKWIDEINNLIVEKKIDYIFPAYDDIIVALVENAGGIKAPIVTSPLDTCVITRSKRQTYNLLRDIIPVPDVYDNVEEIPLFPIFLKPDKGQGSQDIHVVHNRTELLIFSRQIADSVLIATEYLPGEEYTVDCFSDREKGLLFCSGRQRLRTRNGISMNCRIVDDDIFRKYAKAISSKLAFHGAWFYQVKKNRKGVFTLMEIAPRIAGTMALHRVKGINFPLLSLYEQQRIPIEILPSDFDVEIDRALINRYHHDIQYGVVYVDLDDTLLIHDKVNLDLIRFLYQCVNTNKRLVLITKHADNVDATLKKHRLQGIFDHVIHIEKAAEKSDYIKERDAILIDDSFSERKAVARILNIPTFDISMIEVLIDERI